MSQNNSNYNINVNSSQSADFLSTIPISLLSREIEQKSMALAEDGKISPEANYLPIKNTSTSDSLSETNEILKFLSCECDDERKQRPANISTNSDFKNLLSHERFQNHCNNMRILPTHSSLPFSSRIGTSMTIMCSGSHTSINTKHTCEVHNEVLGYVCENCNKLVCQWCTLYDHKDHKFVTIPCFINELKVKVISALESSNIGKKCIKNSIDKTLSFIRHIERNCAELSDNIRKSFRHFVVALEDRERDLLDFVEKLRQRRITVLNDQMAGLKSALSGLAETADILHQIVESKNLYDQCDIAKKVTNSQRQLEQFAAICKDLQPKQEIFGFIPPDFTVLQDFHKQGDVVLLDEHSIPVMSSNSCYTRRSGTDLRPALSENSVLHEVLSKDYSLRIVGGIAFPNRTSNISHALSKRDQLYDWQLNVSRSPKNAYIDTLYINRAIPGCVDHIKTRNSNCLSLSFGTEGRNDAQVSRPWGVFVDKMGQIYIADRRNNRVQVFNSDGSLKLKFGCKGIGNGEFDLPAGICVDIDNRIVVVDKDNHRVQIFTTSGIFLLKFGSYGKEYSQFQYPWDVAVNSRRQIVVTDSRNHRVQQFDSDGRFIRQIVFDNFIQTKTISSPRGVCYTPSGNIIVSDFDNHCLYLIDPDFNEILAAKGQEGSGIQEFNRPSGLCCDDDGRIIVADSKNQRIVVFNSSLEFLWNVEIRPSLNPFIPSTVEEKDRICDVALMPDGRIIFLIELAPDSKEGSNPFKNFVNII